MPLEFDATNLVPLVAGSASTTVAWLGALPWGVALTVTILGISASVFNRYLTHRERMTELYLDAVMSSVDLCDGHAPRRSGIAETSQNAA